MSMNNSDIYQNRCFILFLLLGLIDCLTVYEGEQAVIVCSLQGSFPTWRGPPDPSTTIYALEGQNIINDQLTNANRLSLDDSGNLVIDNTQRSDAGQYTCALTDIGTEVTNFTVIVKPNMPHIMNKTTDGSRTLVRATEDQPVTLICVSRGGYPEPELSWKKGSLFLQPTFKEVNIESDTTFTVTIKYKFISRRSDDRVQFTCQSSYVEDTELPLKSSVLLYLSLKPSAPVMTGFRNANERDTRAFNCYSDGCRPTGNIFWRYNSSQIKRNVTFTNEPAETYRMESSYETSLQRADNGKKLECVVTHEALTTASELVVSINLQIHFAPLSVTLSGNKTIIANGINKLELTCTTGSANPVAKITWRNGQKILLDGIVKTTSDGVYNGMVLHETLTLKPTRDMDGDIISCSTSNTVSSTAVQNKTSLDLTYSPISNIIGVSVRNLTEGDSNVVLQCSASGKPFPQFIWYHEENQIAAGENQHANQSNFTIQSVHRSHYGSYVCLAYNGINPNGSDKVQLNIFFAPLSVKLSGNHQIIADGSNILVLTCTSDTANPIGKLTWKQGQTIIEQHIEVTTSVGDYGGKVITEKLTLKPTRNMDGDIISCTSTNMYSKTGATDKTSLDLKYPSITSVPSVVNATEGDSRIILPCSASSKPPSHFKWFKKGNNTPLYQGTGTVISNALNYSIGVINRSHAGQYRCEADNGIGTPDNTGGILILEVFYGPENVIFSPPAAEYIKREGEILHTITCVSDCYPGCTYIWNNGSADVSLTNTLSLGRLHRMDAATYFCLARNYETGVTRERNLTLHILHSPRPVAGTNSVITATPGTTVILSLTVIAYPVPMEYFWYKRVINDWIELYNFATVTKERTSLQFNLTISSFKREDYGEYKLTVDNGVGNHMTYVFTVKTPGDETETEGDEIETGNDTQVNTGLLVLSVCFGALLVIILSTIGVLASKRFLFRKGRMVQGRYKDGNMSAGSGTDDVQMSTFEGTIASAVSRDADATNDHVYDEVKRRASQEHAYGQLGSNTGSTPKTYENFF